MALATLSILPGAVEWLYLRSRACLAEPPALSPSTMSSVPSEPSLAQSASLPGSLSLRVADWRGFL